MGRRPYGDLNLSDVDVMKFLAVAAYFLFSEVISYMLII